MTWRDECQGISSEDQRLLVCLTHRKWNRIIDDGVSMEIGLLDSFDVDYTIICLRGHGLTRSEAEIIEKCQTSMEKACKLLSFLRLRPNLALVFTCSLFDQKLPHIANWMLSRFRSITRVENAEQFFTSLCRQEDLLDNLCHWGLPSLLAKGSITPGDYKLLEDVQDKKPRLLEILGRKSITEYQRLLDFLIDLNLMTVVSSLLSGTESLDALNKNATVELHPSSKEAKKVQTEPRWCACNPSDEALRVEKSSKIAKLAIDSSGIVHDEFRLYHLDVQSSMSCDDVLENLKQNHGIKVENAFIYQISLVIREKSGQFRYSFESTDRETDIRNYTADTDITSPGEVKQISVLPIVKELPETIFRSQQSVEPIVRLQRNCDFWKLSAESCTGLVSLSGVCHGNSSLFENRNYIAFLRGLVQYSDTSMNPDDCRHYIRLFTNSFLDIATGQCSSSANLFANIVSSHGEALCRPTIIFLHEGEHLPQLRAARETVPLIYIRQGTSLHFHDGLIERVSPDQGAGKMWLYTLKRTFMEEKILNHLFHSIHRR